jgi:uncharacterized protein YdhG (YjbR/CyaY superfamily)
MNALPAEVRATLEVLRKQIRAAAPKAEEYIGYSIPTFRYKGQLVSFGAGKNHCSFYVMSPKVVAAFKDDLKEYDTSPGTVRFPIGKPLPATLVKKLVKARVAENEAGNDPYNSLRAKTAEKKAKAKRAGKRK